MVFVKGPLCRLAGGQRRRRQWCLWRQAGLSSAWVLRLGAAQVRVGGRRGAKGWATCGARWGQGATQGGLHILRRMQ